MAWQLIAKAIAGTLGGALKSTADTQKTNLSGTQENTEQQSEGETANQAAGDIGKIAGSIMKSKGGN